MRRSFPSFLLFLLFLFSSFVTIFSSSSFATLSVVPGNWLRYVVTNSSSTTNYFYGAWPPGHYFGNWTVNVGDYVYFNITSISSDSINGTIRLGFYTFNNVRNIDVASALILSVYPWYGGFITNTSQLLSEKDTFISLNTTIDTIEYYQTINEQNNSISAIQISVSDYYGQNSLFYYSIDSGILLKANTSFGNYSLSLLLDRTNITLIHSTNSKATSFSFSLIICFIVIILYLKTGPKIKKH